jgi:anthraniloyl-CoA monooxygenase
MKVSVVGGGPGGLYLAILLRKQRPDFDVTVFERNTPQDAYGFGVVFSDETLDHFAEADPESFADLEAEFKSWGDIEVRHFSGRRIVSGGHGFSALSRRRLLEILTDRAREVGAHLEFSTDISSLHAVPASDVVVGADGANSTLRRELAQHLEPSVEPRVNKYAWFGTPKVFDRFHFIFPTLRKGWCGLTSTRTRTKAARSSSRWPLDLAASRVRRHAKRSVPPGDE